MNHVYKFDECPNIDLRDPKVIWWNEDYICIEGEKNMEINIGEIYVIERALIARKEWVDSDNDSIDELPFIISFLAKIESIKFSFELESKGEEEKDAIDKRTS